MIRVLSITRSGASVVSMSDLFLSLATGMLLVLHYDYYIPLLASDENDYSLYSVLYSMIIVAILKTLFQTTFAYFTNRKDTNVNRVVPLRKLIYAAAIKVSAYLCLVFLLLTVNGTTFALTLFLTLLFLMSLEHCSANDFITKVLWRGRSLGDNKLKTLIIGLLVLGSIALQPLTYGFIFELHFQIFIVFSSSLMFFSYLYLQKLLLTVTPKDHLPIVVVQMGSLQCIFLLLLAAYYVIMEENGLSFSQQMSSIGDSFTLLLGILLLNFVYELVLLESLKKTAVNRVVITKVTGLLWFNIWAMANSDLELKHYISVIILLFVLFVNAQLFSQLNMRQLLAALSSNKKKKKTTFTQMEMKENENQH